jgi:4-hydroxybenzoate polyprenyltransferase
MLWELGSQQLITAFTMLCCFSFICGWLTDRILGYAGFSVIGNWLLLMLGAVAGLLVYNLMGYRFTWNSQFTMLLTFGSGLTMLFVMLSIKTALKLG